MKQTTALTDHEQQYILANYQQFKRLRVRAWRWAGLQGTNVQHLYKS